MIVGSLTSFSQLGAVLSALFGGSALLALGGRHGKSATDARRTRALLVALLLIISALVTLNVYQWQTESGARQTRLTATLTRPARLSGQPVLDPTLKELGLAEQSRHPLGISTAEAERIVENQRGGEYEIVDIREPAEIEMGTFSTARAVRFPDLLAGRHRLAGKKTIFICHNGNRSSESCMALAEKGIDCRFIIGGLERWIAEGRNAGGFYRSSVLESRALPTFPNNGRLLDTPEVRTLVDADQARFVDVRYPAEYAAGHLPGAINIPVRRLESADLERAIDALPQTPIVVPCYDRRSCFFGEVMGLALTRKGRDFRGRYTVPWDYAPIVVPPPHVAAALAERNLGNWLRARRWLAQAINDLAMSWGFIPVLLGLAILSRLLVLPFALKSDRDQLKSLLVEPEVALLKANLSDDPVRLARALRQLYERHGLTPIRNLLALLGLPILMLAGNALADAASMGQHILPRLGPLAEPDPTFVLPAICGLMLSTYAHWALARTSRHKFIVWFVLAPLTAIAMAFLPAATALYLAVSMLLLLAQRAVVLWVDARREAHRTPPANPRRLDRIGIFTLPSAAVRNDVGTKARRLGQLIQAGMPVPDGIVLGPDALARWQLASDGQRKRFARKLARATGSGPYAVRSSAAAEDGAHASHAGVYASLTDVPVADLPTAIDAVLASFTSERAASYGTSRSTGAIIVQRMVRSEYAGVLFTRSPDAPGLALAELVPGAGEALVSGLQSPRAYRFGRYSGQPLGAVVPPIDLQPLLAMGRSLEAIFGAPQDIEWVWAAGHYQLVQSRDITTPCAGLSPQNAMEWDRALTIVGPQPQQRPTLTRNEMALMLPRPTPATWSLIEALHASGGSVDLACRRLGLGYRVAENPQDLFPTIFGRLYQDTREAARRAPRITRLQIRRLIAQADPIERNYRGTFLPALEARLELLRAVDFHLMDMPTLLRTTRQIRTHFLTVAHVEAEVVNIMADLLVTEARTALVEAGLEAGPWLARSGLTEVETALQRAATLPEAQRARILALALGHRAHLDYELAAPRFVEQAGALQAYANAHRPAQVSLPTLPATPSLSPTVKTLIDAARHFQTLKEDAKHHALHEIALLRRALLALDEKLGLEGCIFQLTLDEVLALTLDNVASARSLIKQRQSAQTSYAAIPPLPADLTLEILERQSWPQSDDGTEPDAASRGTRVAGSRPAAGPAYVVSEQTAEAGAPLDGFRDGDIIVAPFVHPAWLGNVIRSGGIVSAGGGWLNHMAIVARERDIAMIVGLDAWRRIPQNSRLTLALDGTVTQIPSDGPGTALAPALAEAL